jgi:hypothetical protein
MRRDQLEHIIRASYGVTGEKEIVIVGSQAILGAYPNAPATLLVSAEADVWPLRRPDLADTIEGAIGELSTFHETNGYYAQAVGPETATLPLGWEQRLIPVSNENTGGAVGLCPEPHDLVLSKAYVGREKDVAYARAAVESGLVERGLLIERLAFMPVDNEEGRRLEETLHGLAVAGSRATTPIFPSSSTAGTVWVRAHLRGDRPVRGHWRRSTG